MHTKENWVGSIHNPLSCRRAKQKANNKNEKQNKTHTNAQKTHQKHYDQCCYRINSVNLHNAIVFPAWSGVERKKNNTPKNQHGRWSADQFTGIWNIPAEMIRLYHHRDWYGKGEQDRTSKHHRNAMQSRKQQRHNAEPRLLPARSLEMTECKLPHGQINCQHCVKLQVKKLRLPSNFRKSVP